MTEYIRPASDSFLTFDPSRVPSPCFVVDEAAVERNLQILADFQERSGAKVLLALKAFGMYSLGPLFNKYLAGTCASGLAEARLGREEFGGEVHVFSAAYKDSDLSEIMKIADHVILNSRGQWDRFKALAESAMSARPELQIGLRINPEHSEGALPIYDPCTAGSRLGVPLSQLVDTDLSMFSGLHFHTLCQQGYAPLDRTLAKIESEFGDRLSQFEWLNFGGGHLLAHPDYDIEALIVRIKDFSEKYGLQIYLEPGEGIVNKTGVMVAEILDTMTNVTDIAIIDCSATCHMPIFSRCPIERIFSIRVSPVIMSTPTDSEALAVSRATWSATTALKNRLKSAIELFSMTWRITRWLRRRPLTVCSFRLSQSGILSPMR